MNSIRRCAVSLIFMLPAAFFSPWAWSERECPILPSEAEVIIDPTSEAKVIFVTNHLSEESNLYFHQGSWLADGSLLVFWSERSGKRKLYGFLESTGELVQLQEDNTSILYDPSCSRFKNSIYLVMPDGFHEWKVTVSPASGEAASQVAIEDRLFAPLPEDWEGIAGITENSDGNAIVAGFNSKGPAASRIILVDTRSGEIREVAALDAEISHIQASWATPDLIMFVKGRRGSDRTVPDDPSREVLARMWLADLSDKEPWPLYPQEQGELVTHECWWVKDQITFCSGQKARGYAEEAHVKVLDLSTGITRIIGAGAWWPSGAPEEVSKYNWWHASGSPDGRWVAADNWHGCIGIFSALTSRTRLLVQNHRTYGKGLHPHVGWDPSSTKVVFTSNLRGNADVCIGILPEKWLAQAW